jgi:hypothetical protein
MRPARPIPLAPSARHRQPPRHCHGRCITRRQAQQIAVTHTGDDNYARGDVLDLRVAKMNIYPRPTENAWVVYRFHPMPDANGICWLISSDIAIISKRTGKILYLGSAHDEG